jgi:hypothetical protein
MNLIRNILAVILGYAVFVISGLLLFKLSGTDAHADPSTGFIILTVAYGILFSFLGGALVQIVSPSGKLGINYVLAVILAGFAAFSFFKSTGNHYSQLAAIFLFTPASILGGLVYLRRKKSNQ